MSFSVAGYSRGRIPGSTLRSTPWRGPWHYNPRAALKVPGWRCNSGVCAVTPAVAVGGQRLFFFFFFKCLTFGEKSKGTEPTGPQHSGVALTETRVRRIQFAAGLVRLPAVSKAVAGVRVVVGGGHGGGGGGAGSLILLNFQIWNLAVAHTSAKANVILPVNSDFTWLFLRTIILVNHYHMLKILIDL